MGEVEPRPTPKDEELELSLEEELLEVSVHLWGTRGQNLFSCRLFLVQMSCLAGASSSPAPRHTAAKSNQATRNPSCRGHYWGGHRAGGRQHDRQSLQQRHSESRARCPSIFHRSVGTPFPNWAMYFFKNKCPGFHLPPVPSEDCGHQDVLPKPRLPRDPGAVLWTVPEEQIWRGCQEGAYWSGQMTEIPTTRTQISILLYLYLSGKVLDQQLIDFHQ